MVNRSFQSISCQVISCGQLVRIQARVGQEKFKATVLIYTDENGDVVYNYRFEGSSRDHDRDGGRDYHEDKNDRDDD